MLVVVGIVVVLVSIIVPAVLRSRKQARLTVCMNNLRQLGTFYLSYAERNDDYIPLGVSRYKDPSRPGVTPYTPYKPPPPIVTFPWEWPDYHTRNNQFMWVDGAPSAAMGPFLLARMITPDNAHLLYCPLEQITEFRWEINQPSFARAVNGEPVSIIIGYAVRPMRRLWTHDHTTQTVEYPPLMPRLMRNQKVALLAEHPQRGSAPHGSTKERSFNILYADSSVRSMGWKALEPAELYWIIDTPPYPDGYKPNSNSWAIQEDNPDARTIWKLIDEN
jgi:type II secretory pathway pseudopilin PulG